jgi:hypothetical protein
MDLSQLNLRPVQEYLGDLRKQVSNINETTQETVRNTVTGTVHFGQRVARTGIGFGALAYDQAANSLASGIEFVGKAEKKGEELEHTLTAQLGDRVHQLEEQAGVELRRVSTQLKANPAVASSKKVNAQLDRVLAVIMPKSGTDNGASAGANGHSMDPTAYDAMTVAELKALLMGMSVEEMLQMRSYESEHKARVTLLQAIDAEIKARLSVE